ncbi:MAG: hypothetical protein EPN91_11730 [Salinibacterium sp.]|nr:MAG: hypothetical protein EPN91_11730 [Salinibacterium sp.]
MRAFLARRSTVQWLIGVTTGALIMIIIGWALVQTSFEPASGSGGVAGLTEPADSFTIKGNALKAIAPGYSVPLNLTITNTYQYPMEVTGLTVTVKEVIAPNSSASFPCTVDDFEITQVPEKTALTVAASKARSLDQLKLAASLWPQIGIRETAHNQDGCKGASLTLAYSASGRLEK